ncbi:hypothetical protein Tco_1421052 [Tanacetum coccineum]
MPNTLSDKNVIFPETCRRGYLFDKVVLYVRDSSQEGERAEIEPSPQPSRQRAESTAKQMLHGPTEVTVAVMIVPHHTLYPPVVGVALLTKAIGFSKTKSLMLEAAAGAEQRNYQRYPTTRSYDMEAIRRPRPEKITVTEWDKYIRFWNDPKNLARAAQNWLNQKKSVVTSRQGSRSLARLQDEEMKRLEATGEYTEDEINALARGGKLRGHIPGVGRVLPSRATSRPSMPAPDKSLKSMHRKVDFMMSLFRSDSKYSDIFKEFESGGASGSGGCGDDEESGDDEDGEDEDDDGER